MTRALVTGATGFLGRAVCGLLEEQGTSVMRADVRASDGVRALDVARPDDLDAILREERASAIVHLAAAGSGERGLAAGAASDPAAAIRTNVEGFAQVLQAAARHGIGRVVWSSSTTVYGAASEYAGTVDESAALNPGSVYGATKAACEFLGPLLGAQLGVEVVSLRIPMVYGPGRWYGGSQQSLVEMIRAIAAGTPYEIDAGTAPADWVHVHDAATALIALLDAQRPAPAYHVVGHRGSLAQLAGAIAGGAERIAVRENEGGAPDLPAVSDELLRRTTGWQPRFPDAASGAADYLRAVSESNARERR